MIKCTIAIIVLYNFSILLQPKEVPVCHNKWSLLAYIDDESTPASTATSDLYDLEFPPLVTSTSQPPTPTRPPVATQPTIPTTPPSVPVQPTPTITEPPLATNLNRPLVSSRYLSLQGGGDVVQDETHEHVNKSSNFHVGAYFDTYSDFVTAFNHWRDEEFHPMSTFSSHKIPGSTPDSSHPYIDIAFACKHNGCARQRGLNVRPNQKYLASNCPVRVKMR